MPVIKVGGGLSGGNKGSSKAAVNYLEKENKTRKTKPSNEAFFNQHEFDVSASEALYNLDAKNSGQGIKKGEAKFYNLIISPSSKELAELSDDDLKNYTKDVMKEYAKNFNRGVDQNDIVWFAKLERKRQFKGYKKNKKEKSNLPPGVKSGEEKPGDNRHVHVLVRRRTDSGQSLSPLAAMRNGVTKGAAKGKIGFDRIKFAGICEVLMYNYILKKNKNYSIRNTDTQVYQYLKKNNFDFDKAKKLGFNIGIIDQISKKQKVDHPANEVKSEIKRLFGVVMTDYTPKDFKDYIEQMRLMDIKVVPSIYKENKIQGYRLEYDGQSYRASEIHRSLTFSQLTGKRGVQVSDNPKFKRYLIAKHFPEINDTEIVFDQQMNRDLVKHSEFEEFSKPKKESKIAEEPSVLGELKDKFQQVISMKPTELKQYQSNLLKLDVRLLKDNSNKEDYIFLYKGFKVKPIHLNANATLPKLLKLISANKKDKQKPLKPVTTSPQTKRWSSAEKIKIATQFHLSRNYPGKVPNVSAAYPNNPLLKALKSEYGLELTKDQLYSTLREVKSIKKGKGI